MTHLHSLIISPAILLQAWAPSRCPAKCITFYNPPRAPEEGCYYPHYTEGKTEAHENSAPLCGVRFESRPATVSRKKCHCTSQAVPPPLGRGLLCSPVPAPGHPTQLKSSASLWDCEGRDLVDPLGFCSDHGHLHTQLLEIHSSPILHSAPAGGPAAVSSSLRTSRGFSACGLPTAHCTWALFVFTSCTQGRQLLPHPGIPQHEPQAPTRSW